MGVLQVFLRDFAHGLVSLADFRQHLEYSGLAFLFHQVPREPPEGVVRELGRKFGLIDSSVAIAEGVPVVVTRCIACFSFRRVVRFILRVGLGFGLLFFSFRFFCDFDLRFFDGGFFGGRLVVGSGIVIGLCLTDADSGTCDRLENVLKRRG